MEIKRGDIHTSFTFEQRDWKRAGGQAVRNFLIELRTSVPSDCREYDDETKTWTVRNDYFQNVVLVLKEKHFKDPNQQSLF